MNEGGAVCRSGTYHTQLAYYSRNQGSSLFTNFECNALRPFAAQAESHPANLLSKNAFVKAIFAGRAHLSGHRPPEVDLADGSIIVRFQTW